MARVYPIDIASLAADADIKWVDNLLSHFSVPGVQSARQGIPRRISSSGVLHIVLVRRLVQSLGLTNPAAVDLAVRLLSAPDARVQLDADTVLSLDRAALEATVEQRIAEAAETTAPARRGRPPKRVR